MKLYFAREFGNFPFGRDAKAGDHNGEKFREEHLIPKFHEAQQKGEKLEVVLDNVHGLGGSFMHEAFAIFGRQMRQEGAILSEKNLVFTSDEHHYELYIEKIWQFIEKENCPPESATQAARMAPVGGALPSPSLPHPPDGDIMPSHKTRQKEHAMTMKLHFAKEFGRFPFGRDAEDGEYNGKKFREEHLLPNFRKAQKKGEKLVVVMDDVHGLGGSFMHEAFAIFGRQMRKEGVILNKEMFDLTGDEPHYKLYIGKIWTYIDGEYAAPDGDTQAA